MWFVPTRSLLAPAPRALLGRKMELYAGMVENMDHHVGRLIDHLKIGEYDNTIFVVFGDNGAEGTDLFAMISARPARTRLPVRGHQLVADASQRLGDPAVRRLRTDVGAGVDDAVQPVQRAGRPRAASETR